MKSLTASNGYPKDTSDRRSMLTAKDIEKIARDLGKIVKKVNWEKAARDYILKNCVGDIPWNLGIGLFWIIAEEHLKSKGITLPWHEFVKVVGPIGVKKSFAFECKRAAYVVHSMMKEPEIWKRFCEKYLSKTALYKLSLLKIPVKRYWESEKMGLDRDKLMSEIKRVHTISRNQLFLEEEKGLRHTFHGRITKLKNNEITIVFPNKNGMEKNKSQVIGASAIVAFTVRNKGRKKKASTSRKSYSFSKVKSVLTDALTDALTWLVGRIKVIIHPAH